MEKMALAMPHSNLATNQCARGHYPMDRAKNPGSASVSDLHNVTHIISGRAKNQRPPSLLKEAFL